MATWFGFAPGFVNYKKGHTQLTAASDKVYQLLTLWSVVLSGFSKLSKKI
jgi:hypothetical protein